MSIHQPQQGAVLVISLILLVVMTLLAVSSINMSTINLRIVGNMQAQLAAETAVQSGIETLISDADNIVQAAVPNQDWENYSIQFDMPYCVQSSPAVGEETGYAFGGTAAGLRFDNYWILRARNTPASALSGESVEITQGVRLRDMPSMCVIPTP